jgi:D-xylose 1-dehydrogenase
MFGNLFASTESSPMNDAAETTEATSAAEVIAEARHAHVPQVEFAGVRFSSLRGQGVIVTGGATGIGADIVRAFAEQGAAIGFLDRDEAAGRALAGTLPNAHFQPCDVRDVPALQAAMATLVARLGGVDVLVNNVANDERHAVEAVTPEFFDDRIAINLRPHFFATQAVIGPMRERGGGAVVNIGSASWLHKSRGLAVYATAKSAMSGFTRCLAREFGREGIRVNCVVPGWVMTQRQLDLWVDAAGEAELERNQCLGGRIVGADIANMVMFLAADTARMITAQEFIVDAGWS